MVRSAPRTEAASRAPASLPNVVHLIASLDVGGSERQLIELINRSARPERHTVAVFYEPGALAGLLPTPPIQVGALSRRPSRLPATARTCRRVRRLVARSGADVVHAHGHASEIIAASCIPAGTKLVVGRRGRNRRFEESRLLSALLQLAHRRADAMLVNSEAARQAALRHERWLPPIRLIRNGVDLDRFRPSPLPSLTTPTVAVVANLRPVKGLERMLRSLRLVADTLPSVRALIAGEGPERDRLQGLAAQLNILDNVQFLGSVSDVSRVLDRAHVVALSSFSEGFPNALLEGMAMGRPVVATRVGGIPELVRDGVDGVLSHPHPSALANAFLSILREPARLGSMSRAAMQRAQLFGWDRAVRETEQVYAAVTADPTRGRRGRRHQPCAE